MPRVATPKAPAESAAPTWTPDELMKVRHLGAGIIGQEMHDAAQAYVHETHGGKFGPAIISSDPAYNQAGPTKAPAPAVR